MVGGLVLWHWVVDLSTSLPYKHIFCPAICTVLILGLPWPFPRPSHQTPQGSFTSQCLRSSGSPYFHPSSVRRLQPTHFLFHLEGHRAQTFSWRAKSVWLQIVQLKDNKPCWAKSSEVAQLAGQKASWWSSHVLFMPCSQQWFAIFCWLWLFQHPGPPGWTSFCLGKETLLLLWWAGTGSYCPALGTASGVEIDWGSTPVKAQHRCAQVSSGRPEGSCEGQKVLTLSTNTDCESVALHTYSQILHTQLS